MSKLIRKSHNVSVLMYHIVCVAKYRRVVFSTAVDKQLKETCLEIAKRYEVTFLEIGSDQDHVHFLVQSVPLYSPKRLVQLIKSITAREIFRVCPEVKKQLWGGSVLDGRLLHQHGWATQHRERRQRVHSTSRE